MPYLAIDKDPVCQQAFAWRLGGCLIFREVLVENGMELYSRSEFQFGISPDVQKDSDPFLERSKTNDKLSVVHNGQLCLVQKHLSSLYSKDNIPTFVERHRNVFPCEHKDLDRFQLMQVCVFYCFSRSFFCVCVWQCSIMKSSILNLGPTVTGLNAKSCKKHFPLQRHSQEYFCTCV